MKNQAFFFGQFEKAKTQRSFTKPKNESSETLKVDTARLDFRDEAKGV